MLLFKCYTILVFAVLVQGILGESNTNVLPIIMDALVHQQHVRILRKEMPANSKLYCIPLKQGRPAPSLNYMKEDIIMHQENVILPNSPHPYDIETDEVMNYDRLSCILAKGEEYFGPQVFDLIPNLTEEQTEVTISSVNPASDSVSFGVALTAPALVWCNAYTSGRPTIDDLKMVKFVYIHKNDIVTVRDLTPKMNYTLYCYAESFAGTGMRNKVDSLTKKFSTLEMKAAIVNMRDENKDVAFSIKSNVDRQAVCKCIGDSTTVLAMNAGNDYLCRNSINLPLVLCRFYYPTQMMEVTYNRKIDPSLVVVDDKRVVRVMETNPTDGYFTPASVYLFLQCCLFFIMIWAMRNRMSVK